MPPICNTAGQRARLERMCRLKPTVTTRESESGIHAILARIDNPPRQRSLDA